MVGDENLVDHVLDDDHREGGGRGGNPHEDEGEQVAPPMIPEVIGDQPSDQLQRARIPKAEAAEEKVQHASYDQWTSPGERTDPKGMTIAALPCQYRFGGRCRGSSPAERDATFYHQPFCAWHAT